MKIMNYCYENLKPLDNLTRLVEKDDILFFDIETTGLSRQKNHIYLVGCGYYSDRGLNIIQWFAEGENEECAILKEFVNFSSSFSCLVNYNGKSFDIPFTTERTKKYGILMPDFNSVDIYTYVKPLKKILSLNDLTQKTIEAFLCIKRNDQYNGGELIYVYKKWCELNSKGSLSASENDYFKKSLDNLLLHNLEDVLNMHYISAILDYNQLLEEKIDYVRYEINEYTDYSGCKKTELILVGKNHVNIPHSYKTFYADNYGSFIMNVSDNNTVTIRVPITDTTLYYYIDNYKDYFYLPNEDMCILKSMAGGVLKENKMNATKETCKVKLNDLFIPSPDKKDCSLRFFKESVKSKYEYIRFADFKNLNNEQLNLYINTIYRSFI